MSRASAMLALGAVAAFWPLPQKPPRPAPQPAAPSIVEGARLYHHACLSCHGPRGDGQALVLLPNGQAAPPLDHLAGTAKAMPELLRAIGEGGGAMPAWGLVMTPREIQSLALYVASLNPASGPSDRADSPGPTPASFR
ncbi:MAG: cytochrome c [Firmicutes bacterium]|nr:cytochrome c [Bacillota bacterium]